VSQKPKRPILFTQATLTAPESKQRHFFSEKSARPYSRMSLIKVLKFFKQLVSPNPAEAKKDAILRAQKYRSFQCWS